MDVNYFQDTLPFLARAASVRFNLAGNLIESMSS
jgi:hypothetical protein